MRKDIVPTLWFPWHFMPLWHYHQFTQAFSKLTNRKNHSELLKIRFLGHFLRGLWFARLRVVGLTNLHFNRSLRYFFWLDKSGNNNHSSCLPISWGWSLLPCCTLSCAHFHPTTLSSFSPFIHTWGCTCMLSFGRANSASALSFKPSGIRVSSPKAVRFVDRKWI